MSKRSRGWLAKLTLVIVSLAVSFGAAEWFMRVFYPQPLQAGYIWPDGTLRHRESFSHVYTRSEFSNVVSYNSIGMRGPEVAPGKTPGVPRVVFMGDSFVEGKEVAQDEVFTEVLSREAATMGMPLEVINLGVAGYGTGREIVLWERLGRTLEPDIVVLGFYPNDVRNNVERRLFGLQDGVVVRLREPRRPNVRWLYAARKFLSAHSHLDVAWRLARRSWGDDAVEIDVGVEKLDILAWSGADESQPGWELTLALLDELGRQVRESGAVFVVAVFPTKHEVDDDVWASYATRAGLDPGAYDLSTPTRVITEWAERTGTLVIGLRDEFRARNSVNSFYWEIDGHWNAAGHRLAAELILDGLKNNRLVGPDH